MRPLLEGIFAYPPQTPGALQLAKAATIEQNGSLWQLKQRGEINRSDTKESATTHQDSPPPTEPVPDWTESMAPAIAFLLLVLLMVAVIAVTLGNALR